MNLSLLDFISIFYVPLRELLVVFVVLGVHLNLKD